MLPGTATVSHRYHTSISYTVDIGPWNNGGFPPKSYIGETLAKYATTSLVGYRLCGLYRAIYPEPRSWPPPYSSFDDWRSWVGLIRDTTSCNEDVCVGGRNTDRGGRCTCTLDSISTVRIREAWVYRANKLPASWPAALGSALSYIGTAVN